VQGQAEIEESMLSLGIVTARRPKTLKETHFHVHKAEDQLNQYIMSCCESFV